MASGTTIGTRATMLLAMLAMLAVVPPCVVEAGGPEMVATRIRSGLSSPLFVAHAPDDEERLFIVERGGAIRILDLVTGTLLETPYLAIGGLATGVEQGLLGLAFHPDYAGNGFFFVNVTVVGNDTEVRRYQVSGDPNVAGTAYTLVLTLDQPQPNHNGGWLGFGPGDGYLYVATGDGGGANDDGTGHTDGTGNAQDITGNLLGKMLRIDVDRDDFPADPSRNYAIPADNPFVGVTGDDEIWAYGLRNPWRCSFDRETHDLYIGDVGQNAREEIDFQPAASAGGENYGWRLREGTIATPTGGVGGPRPDGGVDPVYDYLHGTGIFEGFAVTGGYVYRGCAIPALYGMYIFADHLNPWIWSLELDAKGGADVHALTDLIVPDEGAIGSIASFGEDPAGELYIVDLGGEVFRLGPFEPDDCNENGIADACDIARGESRDANGNGIPDECECVGDTNADRTVDFADVLAILGDWGECDDPCPPSCAADVNGDCDVGFADVLVVLGNWGDCG